MTAVLALLFLLQTPGPPVSEVALFNQIVDASRPAERLRLGLSYEAKFPRSRYIGDVYSLIMDAYTSQNNIPKMLEYGEKTLHAKPDDLHALVVVARQVAIGGADLDKAARYARHAVDVANGLKNTKAPEGYTSGSWAAFIADNRASAEGTLKYIQQATMNLLRRR
jgi:hypothetical protein